MSETRTWTLNDVRAVIADALWKSGNDRIGFREWSLVADAYQKEADIVLDALGISGVVTVVQGRLQPFGRVERWTPDPIDRDDPGLRLVPLAARPDTDDEPLYRVVPPHAEPGQP